MAMATVLVRVGLVFSLLSLVRRCAADFTGISFDKITEGSSLNLTWDNSGLPRESFPLIVAVSLINETEPGVFGFKSNLSSMTRQRALYNRRAAPEY
jgi:hypothetical protein